MEIFKNKSIKILVIMVFQCPNSQELGPKPSDTNSSAVLDTNTVRNSSVKICPKTFAKIKFHKIGPWSDPFMYNTACKYTFHQPAK
jgi:hypothetical protein